MANIKVIGICGPTCSGKTTLSNILQTQLKKRNIPVEVVHGDTYWTNNGPEYEARVSAVLKELPEVFAKRKQSTNHPDNVNYSKIIEEVSKYKAKLDSDGKGGIVIVESFLLYHEKSLADMCTQKVYIMPDGDQEALILRKWTRKYSKVCSLEDFRKYWDNCVWPQYLEFGTVESMNVDRGSILELSSEGNLLGNDESILGPNVQKVLNMLEIDFARQQEL